ncbi:hypothetical protein M758_1G306600 [Ceratodon purpureus]|nr:hypothetical protein M758_1G306600 [Ceratodon purpureus]
MKNWISCNLRHSVSSIAVHKSACTFSSPLSSKRRRVKYFTPPHWILHESIFIVLYFLRSCCQPRQPFHHLPDCLPHHINPRQNLLLPLSHPALSELQHQNRQ